MASLNNFDNANSSLTNNFMEQRDNENLFSEHYNVFSIYGQGNKDGIMPDILKGVVELNPLSKYFFSTKNINHLQYLLMREVARLSQNKYKIGKQNENELMIIMRSIYLQYSKNTTNVEKQVIELNRTVIHETVPRIISGIENYLSYMRDQGSNPVPEIDRAQNVNITGTKTSNKYESMFI